MDEITLNILKPSVNNLTVRIFMRAANLPCDEIDVWGRKDEPEFVRKDPALLVYYAFQPGQPGNRMLQDVSPQREPSRDGAIVGCNWGPGRWRGKHALEFKGVSDRVRLQVPGAFDSITLVAWVRVDGLPNGNNSLLMCDGWDEGGMHWQIGEDGKLILGVRGLVGTINGHYHALGAFGPERLKQWTFLVTVYDRDSGMVIHYIDGEPASAVR